MKKKNERMAGELGETIELLYIEIRRRRLRK